MTTLIKTEIFKTFEDFEKRTDTAINGVSEEFAALNPDYQQDNETNKGCWNCKKCVKCFYCINCELCTRCDYCINCTNDCIRCTFCEGCSECVKCVCCINCVELTCSCDIG